MEAVLNGKIYKDSADFTTAMKAAAWETQMIWRGAGKRRKFNSAATAAIQLNLTDSIAVRGLNEEIVKSLRALAFDEPDSVTTDVEVGHAWGAYCQRVQQTA
ncbi:MAG TPA: hypothetical protein VHD55_03600 [Candidatus Paceibacterota bacterium]|nr:hypothetical protein [Candidatus Paceibacterota bacterium]